MDALVSRRKMFAAFIGWLFSFGRTPKPIQCEAFYRDSSGEWVSFSG